MEEITASLDLYYQENFHEYFTANQSTIQTTLEVIVSGNSGEEHKWSELYIPKYEDLRAVVNKKINEKLLPPKDKADFQKLCDDSLRNNISTQQLIDASNVLRKFDEDVNNPDNRAKVVQYLVNELKYSSAECVAIYQIIFLAEEQE